MRRAGVMALVGALIGAPVARCDDAASRNAALEAACVRLVTECAAARKATDRDPMVVEHPPGFLWKTTSQAATRHMVNAIAIARDIRQRFGGLPLACAKACDGVLK